MQTTLPSYFSWFAGEGVAVREMAVADASAALFPEEQAGLTRAVPRRVREFTAGRECARQAMAGLGHPPAPIPAGPDRAPRWPSGLVGSITHTQTHCAASVARIEDGYRSIGIDLEPAAPLPPDLLGIICLPAETAWLENQPQSERGVLARAIFGAKECVYKCQYPLSRQMLEFHDLRLRLDTGSGMFVASFARDCPPFAENETLAGFFRIQSGHIACAMALRG